MVGQVSKLQILKLLNEVRKDLEKIRLLNIEKIPYLDLRELARFLAAKRVDGYEQLTIQEIGLFGDKYFDYVETLTTVDKLVVNGSFDIFIKETGLQKENMFALLNESLAAKRIELQELLKREILIPGFPLRILPGKLNLIVAPSHTGKTFYATGLAMTLARTGHKVLFVSTEENEMAFIERTKFISESDKGFENLTIIDWSTYNETVLTQLLVRAEEEKYDYVMFDYLKKSMWDSYSSDHVVMEEINSTILKALGGMKRKLSVFAFIQANRAAYDKKYMTAKDLQEDVDNVAIMIDGGMPAYRSADNVVFLHKDRTSRQRNMIVAKSRRESVVGKIIGYDVNETTFNIDINLFVDSNGSKPQFKDNFDE